MRLKLEFWRHSSKFIIGGYKQHQKHTYALKTVQRFPKLPSFRVTQEGIAEDKSRIIAGTLYQRHGVLNHR